MTIYTSLVLAFIIGLQGHPISKQETEEQDWCKPCGDTVTAGFDVGPTRSINTTIQLAKDLTVVSVYTEMLSLEVVYG